MMTCSCKKPLHERTVATKTRKVAGQTIVEQTRQALVCDSCGVVAWDPPQPVTVLPYVMPRPFVFPQPRPYGPYWNQSPPLPFINRPTIMCGSTSLSNQAAVAGRVMDALTAGS